LNELEVEEVDKAKELEEMKEEWDMFVEGNASRDLRKAGLEKGYVASLLVEINLEEWYLEREFLVRIWQDVRDWDNWAVRREACFKEVLGCIDALSYLSTGGLIGPGKEEELEAPLHTSSEVAQAMSRHVMELMRIDLAQDMLKVPDWEKDPVLECAKRLEKTLADEMKKALIAAMTDSVGNSGAWDSDVHIQQCLSYVHFRIHVKKPPVNHTA
jgi:hypothetical protein